MKPVRVVAAFPTGFCGHVEDFDFKCSEKSLGGFQLRTDIIGYAFQARSVCSHSEHTEGWSEGTQVKPPEVAANVHKGGGSEK